MADATQMHQIIMNLCTNSYHAMTNKGGILDVKLDAVEIDEKALKTKAKIKKGTDVRQSIPPKGLTISICP